MKPEEIAVLLIPVVTSAMMGWMASSIKSMRRSARARSDEFEREHHMLLDGVKSMMRAELYSIHREYVQAGRPVPVDVKEHATSVYHVYSGLGGNGVGTQMWHEILEAHVGPKKCAGACQSERQVNHED